MCFPNDLISFDPCKLGLDPFRAQVLKAAMLCQWKQQIESGASFTCDIQSLFNESACLYTLSEFALKAIQTQLLCDIYNLYFTPPSGGEWLNAETGQAWINPETGQPWLNPESSGSNQLLNPETGQPWINPETGQPWINA